MDDINYMPRPLAVRDKFVLDVEHGGGRRRRQKHLSRQQMFHDNPDKIGYDSIQDFQSRFVGQSPDKLRSKLENVVCSPNPFELAHDIHDKEN